MVGSSAEELELGWRYIDRAGGKVTHRKALKLPQMRRLEKGEW
jgi:hypothetical protein